jgi:hypothetical protein
MARRTHKNRRVPQLRRALLPQRGAHQQANAMPRVQEMGVHALRRMQRDRHLLLHSRIALWSAGIANDGTSWTCLVIARI